MIDPVFEKVTSVQDGELYSDLSGLTTAMDILERVLVRVE